MTHPVLTAALDAVCSGRSLDADEAAGMLRVIMSGEASDAQAAGMLCALRAKGETQDEVAGLARTMRALATPVTTTRTDLVDTAGTGGGRPTFNVSTTAALIAAGAGCAVAKHGNRSATGLSGSADLLEALGAPLALGPEAVGRCIDEVGFGFMFAPAHHAAMRHVVGVRKELGVRTAFNLLGPLTNPAGARRQVIGVSDPAAVDTVAGALARLGAERALVVHGEDRLDELSTSGPTRVLVVEGADVREERVAPGDVGLEPAPPEAVRGGTPQENAATTRAILRGEGVPARHPLRPARDLALLNAGAAVYAGGRAGSLREGVEAAARAVDSGAAQDTLDRYLALAANLATP